HATPLRFLAPFPFSASCAHLHFHSFPTRRSSDLGPRRRWSVARTRYQGGPARSRTRGAIRDLGWTLGQACTGFSNPSPRGCPGRDRKSTRLNSSHVKISYAVFCLKKKKLTTPR